MKIRRMRTHPFERDHSSMHVFGIPTSATELIDIAKAWLVISVIFAILNVRRGLGTNLFVLLFTGGMLRELMIAGITVGVGFLLHELAHKVVAQRYGCLAEFRSDDMMLIFALVMAVFIGFVFVAPGATMIAGRVRPRQHGIIAISGPAVNLVLALFFFSLTLLPFQAAVEVGLSGYAINVFLATFNMLPFWIFDGKKVWDWNKPIWLVTFAISLAMLVPVFLQ